MFLSHFGERWLAVLREKPQHAVIEFFWILQVEEMRSTLEVNHLIIRHRLCKYVYNAMYNFWA